jgi:hypothetical protein
MILQTLYNLAIFSSNRTKITLSIKTGDIWQRKIN